MSAQRACIALALVGSCGLFPLLSQIPFATLRQHVAPLVTLEEALWYALWWLPWLLALTLPTVGLSPVAPSVLTALRRHAPLTLHDSLCVAAATLLLCAWLAAPLRFFHSNLPAYDALRRLEATGAALGYPPLWCMALLLPPLLRHLPSYADALASSFEPLLRHHFIAGYAALAGAALHGGAYMVSWATQGSHALLTNSLPGSCAGWYNSAGYVAVAAMVAMWLTSLERVRAQHRELFYSTHLACGALAFVSTVLHIPLAVYYFAPLLFLYAADRGLRALLPCFAPHASAYPLTPGLVAVRFDAPPGLQLPAYAVGQFVRLRVPAVSGVERHPFSIASCHSEDPAALWVCVKAAGDWSAALTRLAATLPPGAALAADVEGPCGAPVSAHFAYRTLYLVAGGIAITALRPLLASLLEDLRLPAPRAKVRTLHLCWAVQQRAELSLLAPLLADLRAACSAANVRFDCALHCTGDASLGEPSLGQLPTPCHAATALRRPRYATVRLLAGAAAAGVAFLVYVACSALVRRLLPCPTCAWTQRPASVAACFLFAPLAPLVAGVAVAYLVARIPALYLLPRATPRCPPVVQLGAVQHPLLPEVSLERPDLRALYRAAATRADSALFAAGPSRMLSALTEAQSAAPYKAPLYVLSHEF